MGDRPRPAAPRLGGEAGYWIGSILFGAVVVTLVAWFVVRPIKGLPVGAVFAWPGVTIGPIVNGAWGFGTAPLLRLLPDRRPDPARA